MGEYAFYCDVARRVFETGFSHNVRHTTASRSSASSKVRKISSPLISYLISSLYPSTSLSSPSLSFESPQSHSSYFFSVINVVIDTGAEPRGLADVSTYTQKPQIKTPTPAATNKLSTRTESSDLGGATGSNQNQTLQPATTEAKSDNSAGLIAGIVIGALAGAFVMGLALFCYFRSRKKNEKSPRPLPMVTPVLRGHPYPSEFIRGDLNRGFANTSTVPAELPSPIHQPSPPQPQSHNSYQYQHSHYVQQPFDGPHY